MNAMQWVSLLVILKLIVRQDSIEGFNLKWILIPCFIFITTGVVIYKMNLLCEMNLRNKFTLRKLQETLEKLVVIFCHISKIYVTKKDKHSPVTDFFSFFLN